MLISFDVDSVLLDTETIILKKIKEIYDVELSLKDVTYWNFYKNEYPLVLDVFQDISFYNNVNKIQNMDIIMKNVISTYGSNNIQLITSSSKISAISKENCLDKHFGKIKDFNKIKIIHVGLYDENNNSHHKYIYSKNTILIDDGIHNVSDHVEINKNNALLIDYGYGWNQNYKHNLVKRIKKQNDILPNLKNLLRIINE